MDKQLTSKTEIQINWFASVWRNKWMRTLIILIVIILLSTAIFNIIAWATAIIILVVVGVIIAIGAGVVAIIGISKAKGTGGRAG